MPNKLNLNIKLKIIIYKVQHIIIAFNKLQNLYQDNFIYKIIYCNLNLSKMISI